MKKGNVVEFLESLDKDKRFQQKLNARREPKVDPISWVRALVKTHGYGKAKGIVNECVSARQDVFYRNALAYLNKNEMKLRLPA